MTTTPARLDPRYSEAEATVRPWDEARRRLEQAELFWVTTVRPDGRPHVTPLIAVWVDGALCFCTGADERKGRNLRENTNCVLTTGCNDLHGGFDVVIEGEAENVSDDARLQRIADAYVRKYGEEWRFTVVDGRFRHEGGDALVFAVAPSVAFGFGKEPYSQTRYRFD
jgi:general stress protein 26